MATVCQPQERKITDRRWVGLEDFFASGASSLLERAVSVLRGDLSSRLAQSWELQRVIAAVTDLGLCAADIGVDALTAHVQRVMDFCGQLRDILSPEDMMLMVQRVQATLWPFMGQLLALQESQVTSDPTRPDSSWNPDLTARGLDDASRSLVRAIVSLRRRLVRLALESIAADLEKQLHRLNEVFAVCTKEDRSESVMTLLSPQSLRVNGFSSLSVVQGIYARCLGQDWVTAECRRTVIGFVIELLPLRGLPKLASDDRNQLLSLLSLGTLTHDERMALLEASCEFLRETFKTPGLVETMFGLTCNMRVFYGMFLARSFTHDMWVDLARSETSELIISIMSSAFRTEHVASQPLDGKEDPFSAPPVPAPERRALAESLSLLVRSRAMKGATKVALVGLMPVLTPKERHDLFVALTEEKDFAIFMANRHPQEMKTLLDCTLHAEDPRKASKETRTVVFDFSERVLLAPNMVSKAVQDQYFRGYRNAASQGVRANLTKATNRITEGERLVGIAALLRAIFLSKSSSAVQWGMEFFRNKIRNESDAVRQECLQLVQSLTNNYFLVSVYATSCGPHLLEVLADSLQSQSLEISAPQVNWFRGLSSALLSNSVFQFDSLDEELRDASFSLGEELMWALAQHDNESRDISQSYRFEQWVVVNFEAQKQYVRNVFNTYERRFLEANPHFWFQYGDSLVTQWIYRMYDRSFLYGIPEFDRILEAKGDNDSLRKNWCRQRLVNELGSVGKWEDFLRKQDLVDFVDEEFSKCSRLPLLNNGMRSVSYEVYYNLFNPLWNLAAAADRTTTFWRRNERILSWVRILIKSDYALSVFQQLRLGRDERRWLLDESFISEYVDRCVTAYKGQIYAAGGEVSVDYVVNSLFQLYMPPADHSEEKDVDMDEDSEVQLGEEAIARKEGLSEWLEVPRLVDLAECMLRCSQYNSVNSYSAGVPVEIFLRLPFVKSVLEDACRGLGRCPKTQEGAYDANLLHEQGVFSYLMNRVGKDAKLISASPELLRYVEFQLNSNAVGSVIPLWMQLRKSALLEGSARTKLNRRERQEIRNEIVEHLLRMSPSAIHIKLVWRHLVRFRQDLLSPFVGGKVVYGMFYVNPVYRTAYYGRSVNPPAQEVSTGRRGGRGGRGGRGARGGGGRGGRGRGRGSRGRGGGRSRGGRGGRRLRQGPAQGIRASGFTNITQMNGGHPGVSDSDEVFERGFFLLPATYGLHRLVPSQVLAVSNQLLLLSALEAAERSERLKALIRWTNLPTTSLEDVLAFLETQGAANAEEVDAEAVESQIEDKDMKGDGDEGATETRKTEVQLWPGLPTITAEICLRGLTRDCDSPGGAWPFLVDANVLNSNFSRVSVFASSRCARHLRSETLADWMTVVLQQPAPIKITPYKELMRQLAARTSHVCSEVIMREAIKPTLHRDVVITLLKLALELLSVPDQREVGWRLIHIIAEAGRPDVQVAVIAIGPADSPSVTVDPFEPGHTLHEAGILREEQLSMALESLESLAVPLRDCERFAREIVLPMCILPDPQRAPLVATGATQTAEERDKEKDKAERQFEKARQQVEDVRALALASLATWVRFGIDEEVVGNCVDYLRGAVERSMVSDVNRIEAVFDARWQCALNSLMFASGFRASGSSDGNESAADLAAVSAILEFYVALFQSASSDNLRVKIKALEKIDLIVGACSRRFGVADSTALLSAIDPLGVYEPQRLFLRLMTAQGLPSRQFRPALEQILGDICDSVDAESAVEWLDRITALSGSYSRAQNGILIDVVFTVAADPSRGSPCGREVFLTLCVSFSASHRIALFHPLLIDVLHLSVTTFAWGKSPSVLEAYRPRDRIEQIVNCLSDPYLQGIATDASPMTDDEIRVRRMSLYGFLLGAPKHRLFSEMAWSLWLFGALPGVISSIYTSAMREFATECEDVVSLLLKHSSSSTLLYNAVALPQRTAVLIQAMCNASEEPWATTGTLRPSLRSQKSEVARYTVPVGMIRGIVDRSCRDPVHYDAAAIFAHETIFETLKVLPYSISLEALLAVLQMAAVDRAIVEDSRKDWCSLLVSTFQPPVGSLHARLQAQFLRDSSGFEEAWKKELHSAWDRATTVCADWCMRGLELVHSRGDDTLNWMDARQRFLYLEKGAEVCWRVGSSIAMSALAQVKQLPLGLCNLFLRDISLPRAREQLLPIHRIQYECLVSMARAVLTESQLSVAPMGQSLVSKALVSAGCMSRLTRVSCQWQVVGPSTVLFRVDGDAFESSFVARKGRAPPAHMAAEKAAYDATRKAAFVDAWEREVQSSVEFFAALLTTTDMEAGERAALKSTVEVLAFNIAMDAVAWAPRRVLSLVPFFWFGQAAGGGVPVSQPPAVAQGKRKKGGKSPKKVASTSTVSEQKAAPASAPLDRNSPLYAYAARFLTAAGTHLSQEPQLLDHLMALASELVDAGAVLAVTEGVNLDLAELCTSLFGSLGKSWPQKMAACCDFIKRLCSRAGAASVLVHQWRCRQALAIMSHYGNLAVRTAIRKRGKAKGGPEQDYVEVEESGDAEEVEKLVDLWRGRFLASIEDCLAPDLPVRLRKEAVAAIVSLQRLD